MNLQEFIDLRKDCPMCGGALTTKFGKRKQKAKLEDNRFIAVFIMRGMERHEPDYEVGYSFGLEDHSLAIEFYNEWDMRSCVSTYMCDIFRKFHANVDQSFSNRFTRTCGLCFKYQMESKLIDLDLKAATFSSIEKNEEVFVWSTKTEEGRKFVLLDNYIESTTPISDIFTWRSEHDYKLENAIPSNYHLIESLPQIPFVSKEETGARLKKLLIFS
jgi:hypothetical protein